MFIFVEIFFLASSPIEEVTNALYGKSIKFAMTHDVELKLPEMMFDGATFRISPRSIEGNGAIVKLELIPKTEIEARETGRIFKKKICKYIVVGFSQLFLKNIFFYSWLPEKQSLAIIPGNIINHQINQD